MFKSIVERVKEKKDVDISSLDVLRDGILYRASMFSDEAWNTIFYNKIHKEGDILEALDSFCYNLAQQMSNLLTKAKERIIKQFEIPNFDLREKVKEKLNQIEVKNFKIG